MRIKLFSTLALVMGCATEPSHVPELGRYTFTGQWVVAGFNQPATVVGSIDITAASETEIAYTFTLNEQSGPVTRSDTGSWDAANSYILMSGHVGRAGSWFVLPHMVRAGAGYDCYGNAFNSSVGHGLPMTSCSFTKS